MNVDELLPQLRQDVLKVLEDYIPKILEDIPKDFNLKTKNDVEVTHNIEFPLNLQKIILEVINSCHDLLSMTFWIWTIIMFWGFLLCVGVMLAFRWIM